jgi:hypothetical protein
MPTSQDKSAPRIILSTLAVIMFVTVMVIVILQTAFPKMNIKTYDDGYKDGFNIARDLSANTNTGAMKNLGRTSLLGTVNDVYASSLTFTASGLVLDPKVDGVSSVRTVNIGSQTSVYVYVPKTTQELVAETTTYQDAMAAFQKTAKPNVGTSTSSVLSTPTPPAPFKQVKGKISDIVSGDQISVTGEKNQDLTTVDPINALKIVIIQMPISVSSTAPAKK